MKLCRFRILDSSERKVMGGIADDGRVYETAGEWPSALSRTGRQWALDRVQLLAPVEPSKLVCAARNYRMHAAEMNSAAPTEPAIFIKAPSSVIGPGEAIELPSDSARIDFEGELAVVIGRRCKGLGPEDDIAPYVAGFTCINDVTARDFQKRDGIYGRAKSFDTFGPLGPVIETEFDWKQARVETRLNGELRQSGSATEMIFPLDMLMRWISRIMTLLPGDVIATGTPAGVSPIVPGDTVEISIEGIGKLRNPVKARSTL
jgi:2-keto-4-pentenoate hydratase/2-oxohepta-3-ene-1,7-dioic acid hydratase in catechol pathway